MSIYTDRTFREWMDALKHEQYQLAAGLRGTRRGNVAQVQAKHLREFIEFIGDAHEVDSAELIGLVVEWNNRLIEAVELGDEEKPEPKGEPIPWPPRSRCTDLTDPANVRVADELRRSGAE